MGIESRHGVVIIGAGPGGGAAAVRLAQRGVRDVLLLDKDVFPREKTCGSALSPNGVKLVGELGLGDELRRLGYPVRAVRIKTPGGREIHVQSEEAAVILLRKHFDNLLVERARGLGVSFRAGFRATELIREGDRVVGVRGRSTALPDVPVDLRADHVLCADGAHSLFADDPRPKRTIPTLMGWWEGAPVEAGTIEMVFDRKLAPLYGWLFPESPERINVGICIDGEMADGTKQQRNVRHVFQQFLDDNYADRLRGARQIGRLKGHPISYTTWIGHCTAPGALHLGEAARITHNATGEGIYQAMQSGCFAADAIADVRAGASEQAVWRRYQWRLRERFTLGFLMGHVVRGAVRTPLLDGIAQVYNDARVRRAATWVIGSALAGSHIGAGSTGRVPPAARPVAVGGPPPRGAVAVD